MTHFPEADIAREMGARAGEIQRMASAFEHQEGFPERADKRGGCSANPMAAFHL